MVEILKIDTITNILSTYLYNMDNNYILELIKLNIINPKYIDKININSIEEMELLSTLKLGLNTKIYFRFVLNKIIHHKLLKKIIQNNNNIKIDEITFSNDRLDLNILNGINISSLTISFETDYFIDLSLLDRLKTFNTLHIIEDINMDVSTSIFENKNVLFKLKCNEINLYLNNIKPLEEILFPYHLKKLDITSINTTEDTKYKISTFKFLDSLDELNYFSCNFFKETIDLYYLQYCYSLETLLLYSNFYSSIESIFALSCLKNVFMPYFSGKRTEIQKLHKRFN